MPPASQRKMQCSALPFGKIFLSAAGRASGERPVSPSAATPVAVLARNSRRLNDEVLFIGSLRNGRSLDQVAVLSPHPSPLPWAEGESSSACLTYPALRSSPAHHVD